MLHVFMQSPWLVKICMLVLLSMSIISWGLMLIILYTIRPAVAKLKARWENIDPKNSKNAISIAWISIASHSLRYQLNIIAAIAKLSPYVGLLGTVFGMMDALKGLATAGSMPIQQLAPGISEALITTAFGLLVAIPAMLFYQILAQNMQELEDYLMLEAGE